MADCEAFRTEKTHCSATAAVAQTHNLESNRIGAGCSSEKSTHNTPHQTGQSCSGWLLAESAPLYAGNRPTERPKTTNTDENAFTVHTNTAARSDGKASVVVEAQPAQCQWPASQKHGSRKKMNQKMSVRVAPQSTRLEKLHFRTENSILHRGKLSQSLQLTFNFNYVPFSTVSG